MVAITLQAVQEDPCYRADITVSGLVAGDQVITVWRTADGERKAVSGARRVSVFDSHYVADYEVPLGRVVTYDLEVVAGADSGVQGVTADVIVESDHGYIQDPLNPGSAVPIHAVPRGGQTFLAPASFSKMAYEANVSKFNVMGSDRPVAISSRRQAATGVPLSMVTVAEAENTRLRDLIRESPLLIIRPIPKWGAAIPGSATYAAASFEEQPLRHARGGTLTRWETTGDVVRGSSARVLIALWTYQDVAEIFGTYDQKQLAAGGGTYLDDQKNPANV